LQAFSFEIEALASIFDDFGIWVLLTHEFNLSSEVISLLG
jgi:hypothetical protein